MDGSAGATSGDPAHPATPGINGDAMDETPWTRRSSRKPTAAEMQQYVRRHIREERPRFRTALLTDARHYAGQRGERFEFPTRIGKWFDVLRLIWASDTYPGIILYRMQTMLHDAHVPIVPKLLHRFNIMFFDIDIDEFIAVGEGVYIPHGKVCIGGVTRIGRNAILCPWVSIGLAQGSMLGPVLGDNVFVGTGAKILGAVTIGDGAIIGAGSVVTADVAPNTTVAGVPARVIERREDGASSEAVVP